MGYNTGKLGHHKVSCLLWDPVMNKRKRRKNNFLPRYFLFKTFPQVWHHSWSILKLEGHAQGVPCSLQKLGQATVVTSYLTAQFTLGTGRSWHLDKHWGYVGLGCHHSGWDFKNMAEREAKGIDSCWSYQASSHCQFLPTQSYRNQKIPPTSPAFNKLCVPASLITCECHLLLKAH